MDGCPTTFLASPLLQLNPEVDSLTYRFQGGRVLCDIAFDAIMDTGVSPAFGSWEVKVDGVPRAVDAWTWTSNVLGALRTINGAGALSSATVELLNADVNFHALGGRVVLPFGPDEFFV